MSNEEVSLAEKIFKAIYYDYCDRKGFGLEDIHVQDPEVFNELKSQQVEIIESVFKSEE